mmetsp:Transcript_145066/g.464886  ORF Transcript_145066/g.464886 Transcript_145066/m.464886 type:complete len:783 (-) Transcript_145066:81-2429(-)
MARLTGAMLLLGLLACGALATELEAREASLEAAWSNVLMPPAAEAKERVNPVKRVVNLLNKMKSELEAEADNEAEMYDKMVCWCETNEKEKTKAIADAEAKDLQLSAEIEERAAKFGNLAASIEQTKKEIQENTANLEQATEIREKEAAEFREEEKDQVQAITNLRNAVAVLSKHQKTQAMLQMDKALLSPMRVLLRDCALKYEVIVATRAERHLGPATASLLALKAATQRSNGAGAEGPTAALLFSALDVHDDSVTDELPVRFAARVVAKAAAEASKAKVFLQISVHQPIYESRSSGRSAGIYGVMNQMLEEFESELSTAQKEEVKAQEDFKALAAAKTSEIEAGKKKLDEVQAEDAGNAKALSDAKEDLALTRNQRSEDVEFLRNLKLTCNDLDTQMEKRSKTRSAETMAVAEAIAVLTEDDNREMLAKSVSLLQLAYTASAEFAARRGRAAAALRRAASSPEFEADDLLAAWHGRTHRSSPLLGAAAGPRGHLSTLAMAVQLDSFTKVKEMMDTMVAELKTQQTEEVKFKDYCSKELDETERTTYEKTELKKDLETQIEKLEALIVQLNEEIAEAQAQIAQTELEIKKASQAREQENKEFQSVVADQRATQAILDKALMKLKDYYHKNIGKAVWAQTSQTPPVQFNDYKNNAGSSPVIGLIEQIIGDSKVLEAETTAGETQAQADYEHLVKDGNSLIKDLQAAVASKMKAIAAADGDKAQATTDHSNTVGELESLGQTEADLHAECDFVLKNFDVRQKARLQEIESIQAAKGILSGAGR